MQENPFRHYQPGAAQKLRPRLERISFVPNRPLDERLAALPLDMQPTIRALIRRAEEGL